MGTAIARESVGTPVGHRQGARPTAPKSASGFYVYLLNLLEIKPVSNIVMILNGLIKEC